MNEAEIIIINHLHQSHNIDNSLLLLSSDNMPDIVLQDIAYHFSFHLQVKCRLKKKKGSNDIYGYIIFRLNSLYSQSSQW